MTKTPHRIKTVKSKKQVLDYKPQSANSRQDMITGIEEDFRSVMRNLQLDLSDASLKDTPKRVAKMFVNDTFRGMFEPPPEITTFPNKGYDQMLIEKNINLHSTCEHHFVPFIGKCHIAYIPKKEVIGLSKLIRIAQYFAARPQLQERLTTDIANYCIKVLKTPDVAVVIDCQHFCCSTRGAKDINAGTVTSYLGGSFRTQEVRTEFFNFIQK